MSKIEINRVAVILKKHDIAPATLGAIVGEMNLFSRAEAGDERPPPVKKQHVILVSDPEGRLPDGEFAGWVLQIPETESAATTQDRIFRGAADYNTTRKGRMYPVRTVGDALENVAAKFFKAAGLSVRTKTPVLVLRTDNEIPRE
jgi:hypothetical protein